MGDLPCLFWDSLYPWFSCWNYRTPFNHLYNTELSVRPVPWAFCMHTCIIFYFPQDECVSTSERIPNALANSFVICWFCFTRFAFSVMFAFLRCDFQKYVMNKRVNIQRQYNRKFTVMLVPFRMLFVDNVSTDKNPFNILILEQPSSQHKLMLTFWRSSQIC